MASTPFTCFPTSRMTRIALLHFAPFSSADFVCPFLCQSAVAGVAVHSTPLATTEQLARQQGSWGQGGQFQLVRAVGGGRCLPLFGGAQLAINTTMVCPPFSTGMGRRAEAQPGLMARLWTKHARGKSALTPEFAGEEGAEFDWSCWALKWEAGGPRGLLTSCLLWRGPSRDLPEELQEDARRAWFRRWCVLAAAAKACAMFGSHSLFQKKK